MVANLVSAVQRYKYPQSNCIGDCVVRMRTIFNWNFSGIASFNAVTAVRPGGRYVRLSTELGSVYFPFEITACFYTSLTLPLRDLSTHLSCSIFSVISAQNHHSLPHFRLIVS